MDVSWVKKRHLHENGEPSYIEGKLRSIGDQIIYGCPNNMLTDNGDEFQHVTCIWHRQTDTMLWWPQSVFPGNSK